MLKSGDFVLIQFGHNDRDTKPERYADTTTYKSYLRLYVNESRAKGAIPVFVSPMNMNTWNGTALREVFTECDRGADYRGAMINVANELNVPFIDLEKKSAAFMKSVGQSYCTNYHFDLSGNCLLQNQYNSKTVKANLNKLSSGTYCLKVKTENDMQSKNIELQ